MKYICEIDVCDSWDDSRMEYYCGHDCGQLEKKENKNSDKFPFCIIFQKKLKLDRMPFELPAVLRCAECLSAFYPAPEDKAV